VAFFRHISERAGRFIRANGQAPVFGRVYSGFCKSSPYSRLISSLGQREQLLSLNRNVSGNRVKHD